MLDALRKAGLTPKTTVQLSDKELEAQRLANLMKFKSSVEDIKKFNSFTPNDAKSGKPIDLKYGLTSSNIVRIKSADLFNSLGFTFDSNMDGIMVSANSSVMTLAAFNKLFEDSTTRLKTPIQVAFESKRGSPDYLQVTLVNMLDL